MSLRKFYADIRNNIAKSSLLLQRKKYIMTRLEIIRTLESEIYEVNIGWLSNSNKAP